jgi:hypothetical protein
VFCGALIFYYSKKQQQRQRRRNSATVKEEVVNLDELKVDGNDDASVYSQKLALIMANLKKKRDSDRSIFLHFSNRNDNVSMEKLNNSMFEFANADATTGRYGDVFKFRFENVTENEVFLNTFATQHNNQNSFRAKEEVIFRNDFEINKNDSPEDGSNTSSILSIGESDDDEKEVDNKFEQLVDTEIHVYETVSKFVRNMHHNVDDEKIERKIDDDDAVEQQLQNDSKKNEILFDENDPYSFVTLPPFVPKKI